MDFLRDTGKHFTLGYMLQKESVRSRLETGISFTEFSYMVIQAHDFWHLIRTEGCELQMGGSDQWGNITAGIELVARREGRQVHGLVSPLITTATGAKFGKSEAGNVWLDPARTSPYQFYQFWVNTDDRDIERYLKLFTFLRLDRIEATLAEHAADPGRRVAQRLLAREVTATVHGEEAAAQAVETAAALFGGGGSDLSRGGAARARSCRGRSSLARSPSWTCWWPVASRAPRATPGGASRDAASISTIRPSTRWTSPWARTISRDRPTARFVILRKGKRTTCGWSSPTDPTSDSAGSCSSAAWPPAIRTAREPPPARWSARSWR